MNPLILLVFCILIAPLSVAFGAELIRLKPKFNPKVEIHLENGTNIEFYIVDMRPHVWLPSKHFLHKAVVSNKRGYIGNLHNITWTNAPGKRFPVFAVPSPLNNFIGKKILKTFPRKTVKVYPYAALPGIDSLEKDSYRPKELNDLLWDEVIAKGPWTPLLFTTVGESRESWEKNQSSTVRIEFLTSYAKKTSEEASIKDLQNKASLKVLLLVDVFQIFGPLKKGKEKLGKGRNWIYKSRHSIESLVWDDDWELLGHRRFAGQVSYEGFVTDFPLEVIEDILSEEGIQGSLRGEVDPTPYTPITIDERYIVFKNLVDYFVLDEAAFSEFR